MNAVGPSPRVGAQAAGSQAAGSQAAGSQALRGDRDLERVVARVLAIGTYLSVGFLVAGSLAMLVSGISPLAHDAPRLDPARLPGDLVALRPAGFLWVGIVVAIAMPATRVAASLAGYLRRGDRRMAAISLAILAVIALGVVLSMTTSA